MNRRLAIVLGMFFAVQSVAGETAKSPLIGQWAVDVTQLPMPPEARPQAVTITFSQAREDSLSMTVRIVNGSGEETLSEGTGALDGTTARVSGSPEADTFAMKMPSPSVLVLALAKGGIPASTRVYAVAGNSASMVETAVYFGTDGRPIMRTNYFVRVP